jgi:hypothetical protein
MTGRAERPKSVACSGSWPSEVGGVFAPGRRLAVRALAEGFVPEIAQATPAEWEALEAVGRHALARRPPALERQLVRLIGVIGLAARLRYGRPLSRLTPRQRTALLEALSRSRLLLLRRGIWGLRTLILMGWYTQPAVAARIGYRANPLGWAAPR